VASPGPAVTKCQRPLLRTAIRQVAPFRPYPTSYLPALYPFGYGAYLYACLRARTGRSPHAFAYGLPLLVVALACGSPYALLRPFRRCIAATPLLSGRSPWRRSLPSATVATPFGCSRLAARLSASLRAASVRLGLDFARYLCHSIR